MDEIENFNSLDFHSKHTSPYAKGDLDDTKGSLRGISGALTSLNQFKQSSSPVKRQYIDLDAMVALQDNIKQMEVSGQLLYYLGWSGTDIDGELIWDNTTPLDFSEEE